MKKYILLAVGIIIGLLVGLFYNQILGIKIEGGKTYGALEAVYYISSSLLTIFTFLAIIVAIWGNDIRNFFNREKCTVEIEDDSFHEDINGQEDANNITAKRYYGNLLIKNTGNREIEDCQVRITRITYRNGKNEKENKLSLQNDVALWVNSQRDVTVTILPGDSKLINIINVFPDSTSQTPDNANQKMKPRRLETRGYPLKDKYSKRGVWSINYKICTPHKTLKNILVTVTWDGVWHNRETEMNNALNINLKEIKS